MSDLFTQNYILSLLIKFIQFLATQKNSYSQNKFINSTLLDHTNSKRHIINPNYLLNISLEKNSVS